MKSDHMSDLILTILTRHAQQFKDVMVKLSEIYHDRQNFSTDQFVGVTLNLTEHDDYQFAGIVTSLPETDEIRYDFIFSKQDVADLLITWTYPSNEPDNLERLEASWKEMPVRIDDLNYLVASVLELAEVVAGMDDFPDTKYVLSFPA